MSTTRKPYELIVSANIERYQRGVRKGHAEMAELLLEALEYVHCDDDTCTGGCGVAEFRKRALAAIRHALRGADL